MKKLFSLYLLISSLAIFSQTDYSASWEDFYSYNNVKYFTKVDTIIYALTDNAVFTYNTSNGEINKLSSVQGLSGEPTAAIHYNKEYKRLVIGYKNGLVEVVDDDGRITISSDIVNFNQSGEKSINHISEFNGKLYLSTPFAVVVYDIKRLEFGDTYFIGNNSASIKINETIIVNNTIYAVTESGIFKADVTSNLLIDSSKWTPLFTGENYEEIVLFNDVLYVTKGANLYRFDGTNTPPEVVFSEGSEEIKSIKTSATHLSIALAKRAIILDTTMTKVGEFTPNTIFNYTLNNAFFEDDKVFLATKEFGILVATNTQPSTYLEIHPDGPLSNDVFSITAQNNNLWVVYGGYDATFTPVLNRKGYSHFNGESWVNTNFNSNLPNDLVDVTIDPNNKNRVYISALGVSNNILTKPTGGLLVVEDNIHVETYNHLNSSFTPIGVSLPLINIRVSGSVFDSSGNLWATNYETDEELVKFSASGKWSSVDLRILESVSNKPGLTEIVVDRNNSIWIGTRRNGVYVYNENGGRKKALIATPNLGNLPDANVNTVAVDKSNRIWLGTKSGLVVYSNASGVFEETVSNASPIIILDDGIAKKLGGDQTINTISVDGADNKWIGTDNGGVLYTNPSGQKTIANFSKQNSPLPSNRILKIRVDNSTGKVYFATDKGIVAYNSNVAPFGDVLGEVYAYPNPALRNHETITIDGRNGTHLPKGTNVKILDVAGNLVYETNVVEGQELQGGKVVWNKKNLAGNKVASGVYIVLLSNDDASETSVTKIAIVN
ncbi:hypothetical protein CW731_09710 [Polaribacter sp. ALD11]|uniref:type IX secretion system anionic LPS delivery protein PorZ n=1 Tax=Polaribacter sp. ALD11 TaxID=2058137 RepID=UPI000C30D461|nr:two-component regulator propeller domain-containing protein [Polaribacter sp. ALD11]AUC85549.1 hypothetical protein CW731_09710 [Polaribacter sp. ALD11]